MKERFSGTEGRRRLVTVLRAQSVISGSAKLAEEVADAAEVRYFEDQEHLISQGSADNCMFLILVGVCEILVNERLVAERGVGDHVGEMSAIDPSCTRSASVRARGPVVAASLTDSAVSMLGSKHPELYRRIAVNLGRRLRQRGDHVRPANGRPRIFMGSSVEGLNAIRALQKGLSFDRYETVLWTDNVVPAGTHVCDALLQQVRISDFALFHVSADDRTWSRTHLFQSPRDNVIFELGMFMGVLQKERAFLLVPRGESVKIPTDLLGITPLSYAAPESEDLWDSRVGHVVTELRRTIERLGVA